MAIKSLKKMEILRGFIQIPAESRAELIENVSIPCATMVNGNQANLDRYGRLWSPYLRKKFSVGTQVEISRVENGYKITPVKIDKDVVARIEPEETKPAGMDSEKEVYKSTSKQYFEFNSIRIFNCNILELDEIENNSIDFIVTSPPYDVDIKYENYDDGIPYDNYLEFSRKWLAKCYSLSKPDGRLCLNIPLDKNKGGQQSVCADITTIAKKVGWKYHSTIVWNEQNISRRTAWGSWLSASAPFVIAPVEVILVLYKEKWKKTREGKSDITREEFIEWTNGVWNFSGENRTKIGHPSPFPVELPKRCIKLFSFVEDTVLDPFLGSGTSLIACLETGRAGIGVEINRNYCELAVRRLKEHGILQKKLLEVL